MQRRKALAIAGAVTVTALAAAFAIGANFGLFGLTRANNRVSTLRPPPSAQLSSAGSAGSVPNARHSVADSAITSSTTSATLGEGDGNGGDQQPQPAGHDDRGDEQDD